MDGRRLKLRLILIGIATSALTLLAWSQTWFAIGLVPGETATSAISVGGAVAAGGLSALALAGLALVGALTVAGRIFRVLLGALESLIGATVTLSAVVAVTNPVGAAAAAITKVTGVSGTESVAGLVRSVDTTLWPWVAAALGVIGVALGVAIVVTASRWPSTTRKYQAVRFEHADGTGPVTGFSGEQGVGGEQGATGPGRAAPDRIGDWDSLSDGSDPTSR